jgi:hypothetical protein
MTKSTKPTKTVRRTPAQVIKLWVKALRSGEYEQTTGVLKDKAGYCCLGVLCELAAKDGGPKFKSDERGHMFYAGELLNPPRTMSKFLGITRHLSVLVCMNDNEDKNFDEIADYIEKNVKAPA